jgi:hypothetical protein
MLGFQAIFGKHFTILGNQQDAEFGIRPAVSR